MLASLVNLQCAPRNTQTMQWKPYKKYNKAMYEGCNRTKEFLCHSLIHSCASTFSMRVGGCGQRKLGLTHPQKRRIRSRKANSKKNIVVAVNKTMRKNVIWMLCLINHARSGYSEAVMGPKKGLGPLLQKMQML